jgi:hypothetical protein
MAKWSIEMIRLGGKQAIINGPKTVERTFDAAAAMWPS